MKLSSAELIKLESKHAAHNYHPIPVVLSKGEGVYVWDIEGNRYYDFLSSYSAISQGHRHPAIMKAMREQMERMTLCSRAFYNDMLPRYAEHVTKLLGYDMILPMNSGAEAVETAIKLSRKWGYKVKQIPTGQAIVVCCKGCFHGRTIAVISMSDDPSAYEDYSPYLPGLRSIPYNDVEALKTVLEAEGNLVCAFLVEPIQGEAGVVVPDEGYLSKCYDLCRKHNVLFVGDEVQTGLGRTGRMLATEWENVRSDILILGKALSGGTMPVSAVLANSDIMLTIQPGEHGSTYGGNPLACAVAMASLDVIVNERLAENAFKQGTKLMQALNDLKKKYSFISQVRGKGLLIAIVINHQSKSAWDLCMIIKKNGLLCKPTHEDIVRFAPPLVITDDQVEGAISIVSKSIEEFSSDKC
ncbi:probable ornithine aminotransferase [Schistocerca gregaria]|uniref:probable ornithine aminotransferase n=1 Tax=Schistocerca gregaria TaxID=7010 RepID=UPI00211DF7C4|nr:probable ornithine aminotransferase [Schistocerca gregaria]